jgi:pyruvate dehydrogenase E2 component (dihydrolipoamide acetyltransferase)
MAVGVIMPRQGQSVESCIIEWRVKEGDTVKEGDILFAYETDKASFEEESPAAGTVLKLLVEDGDDVPCLDTVLVLGQPGEDISSFVKDGGAEEAAPAAEKAEEAAAPKAEPVATAAAAATASDADVTKISPRAKGIADRQGLDLSKAVPTGPNGRIIERDVAVLAEKGYKVTGAASGAYQGGAEGSGLGGAVTTSDLSAAPAVAPAAAAAPEAAYVDVKLSGVRKAIAKSMHASLSQMAQLTHQSSFDATAILAYRERIKSNMEKLGLPNITLNDIVLYAVSRTLKKHPDLNAHFLGDSMRLFSNVNLGMAVDTERGLLVPTVFGAEKLSLAEIAANAKELAAAAQSGKISPDLLSGGTFTVSNLGAFGIEMFTPVINPPQTAILGVCNITYRQKKVGDTFVTYPAMGLSLTYDHRAVDGAPASRFLKDLCASLEAFDILLAK